MAEDQNNRDPNSNSIGQDESTVWREEQLRQMELRMLGMDGPDYGSGMGQFITPVPLAEAVPNYYGNMQVLEQATSQIDVSQDPNIASTIQMPDPAPAERRIPEIPADAGKPDSQTSSEPRSLWPPGLGRAVDNPQERRQILQEALSRASQAPERAVPPGSPPAQQAPQAASQQPQPAVGAGAVSDFETLPDFGDIGATFYQDPTTSQVGLVSAASDATDAVDNHTELVVELLGRLTANFLRHEAKLNELLDKVDSEDEADEY